MEKTKNNPTVGSHAERCVRPYNQLNRVSDSLQAVAGDLAHIFGEIDPFPHSEILGKPRSIIHLTALVYAKTNSNDLAKQVADQNKFSASVEICFGYRIIGLEGILKKCPPCLFGIDSYKKFLKIIHCENAQKVLRHSEYVKDELIETLFNLPAEFRIKSILSKLRHPDEALIIDLAAHGSSEQRQHLAQRLCETRSLEKFWEAICENLIGQISNFPEPPAINHPNFYPVTSLLQVMKTAQKFQNCLRQYLTECANGELALFIFARDEELAVIGIQPRFGSSGSVLEIKGIQNAPLRDQLLEEIHTILKMNGFRIVMEERHADVDDITRGIQRLKNCNDPNSIKETANDILKYALEHI